jgi:hypothetical protein
MAATDRMTSVPDRTLRPIRKTTIVVLLAARWH